MYFIRFFHACQAFSIFLSGFRTRRQPFDFTNIFTGSKALRIFIHSGLLSSGKSEPVLGALSSFKKYRPAQTAGRRNNRKAYS